MKAGGIDFAERFAEEKYILFFVKTFKGSFVLTQESYEDFDKSSIVSYSKMEVAKEEYDKYLNNVKMPWQEVKKRINEIIENKKD